MPRLIPIVHEGWLHKPAVSYADALTLFSSSLQPRCRELTLSRIMPITFGSVGDIISLSLLIKDLIKSLDQVRGSSAEYQDVIADLCSLDRVLLEVEVLLRSCDHVAELNALRATADIATERCRKCIASIRQRMANFEEGLESGSTANLARRTASKIRWQLSAKEDLAKFRAEINAHYININLLLTTTGM